MSRAADLLEFYSEVGYEHLIPSYVKYNWSWVEYYNVDIYILMALIVSVPSYLVYKLACRCFHHGIFWGKLIRFSMLSYKTTAKHNFKGITHWWLWLPSALA